MSITYHIENENSPTFLEIDEELVSLIQKDFNEDGTFSEATSVVVLDLNMLENVLIKLKHHFDADKKVFITGAKQRGN